MTDLQMLVLVDLFCAGDAGRQRPSQRMNTLLCGMSQRESVNPLIERGLARYDTNPSRKDQALYITEEGAELALKALAVMKS